MGKKSIKEKARSKKKSDLAISFINIYHKIQVNIQVV